jgi:radical SAM protein with 4Fe4S-binding SPASM domain
MQTQPYAELSLGILRAAGGPEARLPMTATLELTRRCPLECSHCYNNLPMDDAAARNGELTTDEYKRILDELVDLGCLWVLFSGGEIFARRDFFDIYRYAKERGFLITLFTNATMITERVADQLAEWRPFAVEVTLYGNTKETYEALTRIPGSYDHCIRGIRLMLERNLPVKLKTVAVTVNKHEVWDMKRFAEEELGVEFKFDAMINPRIDCSLSPLAVRLEPRDIVELDLADPQRAAEWRSYSLATMGPLHREGHEDELYHCGGGVNSFAMDPWGEMSICVLSHRQTYNIRGGSVREGWQRFLADVRAQKITRPTKCHDCGLKSICGMCPANGELENRDPETPVDYLCQVAHLRANVFDIPIPRHGPCEYCEGGTGWQDLTTTAYELREQAQPFVVAPVSGLPLTAAGCASGGCSSCSAHGR